jgi:hypothetical protein
MSGFQSKSPLEKWGAVAMAITAILTLVFLLFPDLKPQPREIMAGPEIVEPPARLPEAPATSRTPEVNSAPARTAGDVILGTWDQYTFLSEADLKYGGTFVVSRSDGRYVMSAQSQREDAGHTIGLSDVDSDGRRWTFRSNWGGGRVATFALERVTENVFEGAASLGGFVVQRDRWVRKSGR